MPLQLEMVPFIFLIFIIWHTTANFSKLPDTIPTHFNFQGAADGFGGKGEIFISAGMGVFSYLLITGIGFALALIRDPKTLINLPASVKDRLTPGKAEELRIFLVRCLFALKLVIMVMNAYLIYGSIETALNHWPGLGYWPVLFVILILALAFLMVYSSLRLAYSR